MLTQLQVINTLAPSNSLDFGLDTFRTNPYQILDVEGLGPVPAELSSSPYATTDGEEFTNSRVNKRNIVLRLGYNPNYASGQTVATLRQSLYAYFMPKNKVQLNIQTSGISGTIRIEGIVETVEPVLFSQTPEVSVSILCPMPYFESTTETVLTGKSKSSGVVNTHTYPGTVPCGLTLKLFYQTGDATLADDFYFYVKPAAATNSFDYTFDLDGVTETIVSSNNYVWVDTRPTKKDVYRKQISPANVKSLFSKINPANSIWPFFTPGSNHIFVRSDNPQQSWEIRYKALYGGL